MSRLSLYLLGAPGLELDDQPIDINRRKALALFAYLVLTRQPYRRESLATFLWPDVDQSRALANLSTQLWTLNKACGEGWLEAGEEVIALLPEREVWLDVEQFRKIATAPPAESLISSVTSLSEAAALYRGDFLAGFTLRDSPAFDEWQFFETENLRRELAGILEKLVRCHILLESFESAIPYAQRWLSLDQLHEPAHRELMRLYQWSGQRAAALRQYQQCEMILENELGIGPDEETTALYQDILKHQSRGKSARVQRTVEVPVTPGVIHVPPQTTLFVGREHERDEIAHLLDDPACRLLTLLGPGGIGKTRLSLQMAVDLGAGYPDGAYFVPLAPAEYLLSAFADALKFSPQNGDPKDQLLCYLSEKRLLLITDNFEHLLDSADLLSEILTAAPGVKILATSRERLNLQEEWIYDIQGLPYPPDANVEDFDRYGAVQLFLQSARRVRADFALSGEDRAAVRQICYLVDGMPLGIELATAWLHVLSCPEIAQEIERSLDFLTTNWRNLPARHRSVRAVMQSSWDRLTSQEAHVLSQLSIFRGTFDREAAQAVTGASLPILLALVSKSLLRRTPAGRYEMHELLRQFTAEMLDDPHERDAALNRHAIHYAAFLQHQEPALKGNSQIEALDRIELDTDNIRVAWHWAIDRRNLQIISAMLPGLTMFYMMRSRLLEHKELFLFAVTQFEQESLSEDDQMVFYELKAGLSMAYHQLAEHPAATKIYSEIAPFFAPLDTKELALTFMLLGIVTTWSYVYERGLGKWSQKALHWFEVMEDRWGMALAYRLIGDWIHYGPDGLEPAKQYYQQSFDIAASIGDLWGQGLALKALGSIALAVGDYAEAEQLYRQGRELNHIVGDHGEVVWAMDQLIAILIMQGRYDEAADLAREAMTLARQLGNRSAFAWGTFQLGDIALAAGRYEEASEWYDQSVSLFQVAERLSYVPSWIVSARAALAFWQRDYITAKQMIEENLVWLSRSKTYKVSSESFLMLAISIAALNGDLAMAKHYILKSLKLIRESNFAPDMLMSLAGLGWFLSIIGPQEHALEILLFVCHHPVTPAFARTQSDRLLSDILSTQSPEIVSAAEQRAAAWTKDTLLRAAVDDLRFF
ncbi:MAG TPA: BTAD domain-containing putative transcriptional regulator [Aggregatilineaceae bacterium]|nr:BTAD domain-containing putative transcriptional regulator [Aggregatilineaceae bacterium]